MVEFIQVAAAAAVVLAMTGPAQAADDVAASRTAILSGNFAVAARSLEAERRIFPDRQDVLINLAAAYANSGRMREAAVLYQRVLSRRDILMDVDSDRTASAHSIANLGLSRIAMMQTAAR